jgi:hypothetical protein
MSIFLNVNVSTADGGLIQNGTDLSGSATGGAALVNGTAVAVAAGDLTTSGSGTGLAVSVTVTGGVIATISVTSDGDGYSVGDTVTIPASASGTAPESEWGSDIVITLTSSNIVLGQAIQKIPMDDFGCITPQPFTADAISIELLQPGFTNAWYKITFTGTDASNDLDTAWAVSQACQDAIQSTSDVTLNGYLPTGVKPVQVTYSLA